MFAACIIVKPIAFRQSSRAKPSPQSRAFHRSSSALSHPSSISSSSRASSRGDIARATRDDAPVRKRITTTTAPAVVPGGRSASVDAVAPHGVVLPQGCRAAVMRRPSVGVGGGVSASRRRRWVSSSPRRARTRFSLGVTHDGPRA